MTDRAQWKVGEYNENLGYDCMTGGVRVGPVVLDGADYGQRRCQPIEPADLARMMADAHMIAGAHRLRAILQEIADSDDIDNVLDPERNKRLARAALREHTETRG